MAVFAEPFKLDYLNILTLHDIPGRKICKNLREDEYSYRMLSFDASMLFHCEPENKESRNIRRWNVSTSAHEIFLFSKSKAHSTQIALGD